MLLFLLAEIVVAITIIVYGITRLYIGKVPFGIALIIAGGIAFTAFFLMILGLRIVNPNEALVLTLFGEYYGTIRKSGFYFVHPLATGVNPENRWESVLIEDTSESIGKGTGKKHPKGISTKIAVMNKKNLKVDDKAGNPIMIGSVVIWRVVDPTKAVFHAQNYQEYLSLQCDSAIRSIARLYPYDTLHVQIGKGDSAEEKTLRGNVQEIAASIKMELKSRVEEVGLEIEEVRITHLSYAEEIAAIMLQRQQAAAMMEARQKMVRGAVGMVKMAMEEWKEEDFFALDQEQKATLVNNLFVMLCDNKEIQQL